MATTNKMQNGFVALITALTIPIIILNLLGGIISGIWLIILGEWGEIFRGIFFMIVSGFVISIALMPSLLFAAPAALAIEKGKKLLGIFFASISILYIVLLMTVWCIWIMWLFVSSVNDSSLIPLLIWSYGVALAPWVWLAQKDQQGGGGNEYSMFTTFFAQISYMLAMVMFFFGATIGTIAVMFGTVMLLGAILQVSIAFGREIIKSFSNKEETEVVFGEEKKIDTYEFSRHDGEKVKITVGYSDAEKADIYWDDIVTSKNNITHTHDGISLESMDSNFDSKGVSNIVNEICPKCRGVVNRFYFVPKEVDGFIGDCAWMEACFKCKKVLYFDVDLKE